MFPNISEDEYENLLRKNKNKRYFLLKRNVTYVQLQQMKNFQFSIRKEQRRIYSRNEEYREYPFGSLGKITVGKVKILQSISEGQDSIVPVKWYRTCV